RRRVVERDRRQHQPGERAAALRVEDHAEDQQQPVRVAAVLARAAGEVERQENRQEQEKKGRLCEKHYSRTLKIRMCWRGSDSSTFASANPSASTSIFASATDILCSNLIGTVGSSLRYSTSTMRPPGLSAVRSFRSIACGCENSW